MTSHEMRGDMTDGYWCRCGGWDSNSEGMIYSHTFQDAKSEFEDHVDESNKEFADILDSTPTIRTQILNSALSAVSVERNAEYGEPKDNLGLIARYWSVLFGIPVTAEQVARANVLTKVARLHNGPSDDSWVDIAGYSAIGGEVDDR